MARVQQANLDAGAWWRILDFLEQENIYLKNRIIGLLHFDLKPEFVDALEHFHSKMLEKDSALSVLRHDVSELSALVTVEGKTGLSVTVLQKKRLLSRDVQKMGKAFERLKKEFNSYIYDVLLPNLPEIAAS